MPFKQHLCCLAVPRKLKAHTDPFWITDDILNNALSRFTVTKLSKRHGGCVPGPLEARRRASKRRVMNLASPPAGVLDPGFLPAISSGLGSTGFQWQASNTPASQELVPQVEDGTYTISQSMKQMLIKERSSTFTAMANRDQPS